jgi:hypothetical protein
MQRSNTIVEFRQQIYRNAFTRARDAQFELMDALLLSPVIRSYPELSLSPPFTSSCVLRHGMGRLSLCSGS